MAQFELYNRCSEGEFARLKADYADWNKKCGKSLIFHVGTGAGLYSELGALLETVAYCYQNRIRFELYADDANFAGGNGWNSFFESFCEESHNPLNHRFNYRYRKFHIVNGRGIPNLLIYRKIGPEKLKREEKVDLLTQDTFETTCSREFHDSRLQWPELDADGRVWDQYAKLSALCLRYNEETSAGIQRRIAALNLPEEYVSIQIRGGDKSIEYSEMVHVEECIGLIEKAMKELNLNGNVFVFTDDYTNIEKIREKRPDWNVYTLCREDERGYYNDAFNKVDWTFKKSELTKLFAMVELCIHSPLHIGCKGASVNTYIRSARFGRPYVEYEIGKPKTAALAEK